MPENNTTPGERVVPESALFSSHIRFEVILADDSSYPGQAYISNVSRNLNVKIFKDSGYSMADLFGIFNDPEKTRIIRNQKIDTDEPTVFEGFIKLLSIRTEYDGGVMMILGQ